MSRRIVGEERKPREPRSGVTELREFFVLNPGGELSIAEVSNKLDVSTRTAMDYLGQLRGEGLLTRVSKYRLAQSD